MQAGYEENAPIPSTPPVAAFNNKLVGERKDERLPQSNPQIRVGHSPYCNARPPVRE